jgi:ABC-2 type transport system permease protein
MIPVQGAELRRLFSVATALAISGFKLRYFGSVLGYLWSLVRPLLVFAVLYLAITKVIGFGGDIPHYPAYLVTALILFEFFSATTSEAEGSLVENQGMIRSVAIPPLAIPLSVVLRALLDLAIKLVIIGVVIAISDVPITRDWLQIPFLLAFLIVFAVAMAGLLSTLYVNYRDVNPIWEVVLQVMFWGSPIVYTIERVPDDWRTLMLLNPFALFITQVRHAVFDPSAPAAWNYFSHQAYVLIPLAIVGAALVAAVFLLRRTAPRLAEEL